MTYSSRPSRRVRRLLDAGHLSDELLAMADREADLLEDPYIGVVHVELARMRLAGEDGKTSVAEPVDQRRASPVVETAWTTLGVSSQRA